MKPELAQRLARVFPSLKGSATSVAGVAPVAPVADELRYAPERQQIRQLRPLQRSDGDVRINVEAGVAGDAATAADPVEVRERAVEERLIAAGAPRHLPPDFKPNPDNPFAASMDSGAARPGLDSEPTASVSQQDFENWLPQDWLDLFDERVALLEDDARTSGTGFTGGPEDAAKLEALGKCIEMHGKLPADLAATLAGLLLSEEHKDFFGQRWMVAKAGAIRFAFQWALRAAELGWTYNELFGLDPTAPATRVDKLGIAWLLGEGGVVEIDGDKAMIRTRTGALQRFSRRSLGSPARSN